MERQQFSNNLIPKNKQHNLIQNIGVSQKVRPVQDGQSQQAHSLMVTSSNLRTQLNYWLKDELPAEFGQPVHKDISPRPPTEPQELYGGTTAVFDDEYKSTFMMESCRINEDDEELHAHMNLRQSKGMSRRNQLLKSPGTMGGTLAASGTAKDAQEPDKPA